MRILLNPDCNTVFTCICCGKQWGFGIDVNSSGLCIECFAAWAKSKKECFGTHFGSSNDCKFLKYCQEYYGIKQNLLR